MTSAQLTLFFFSGIGILNSVFFSVWLFVTRRGNKLSNTILAFLLLALVVRVAKSIFYFLLDGVSIAYINAGLVGKMMIGPLLLLYVFSITRREFSWKPAHWLHFMPAAIIAVTTPFLTWDLILLGYDLAMAQMLVYIVFACWQVRQYGSMSDSEQPQKTWLRNLCIAVILIWCAYLSQMLMGGLTIYAIGAAWFAMVMYAVLFVALRQRKLFDSSKAGEKYKTSSVSGTVLDEYVKPLMQLIEEDKVYLNRELSLPVLAGQVGVRPDVLSRLINEKFEKNFNDFINCYRVAVAREILSDPAHANAKIAGVAIDSGFKSISAFNTAFKKLVGMTPSQYRDQCHRAAGTT
jgi:AraC-like DNA-binding protein